MTATHVLYVDFEDSEVGVVERMRLLGATDSQISERFHYVRPNDPFDATARSVVMRVLERHDVALAVLDGVTEAMKLNALSILDNDDIAEFYAGLPRLLSRRGVAVVLIDHVTKDKDSRGRYAIGGQHKLAGIDGAAYSLEVVQPFRRGGNGLAKIKVQKDRPGHVRSYAVNGVVVGDLQIKSSDSGQMTVEITPPQDQKEGEPFRHTVLMERLSRHFEINPGGYTKNELAMAVKGQKKGVLAAVDDLIEIGFVAIDGGRFWLKRLYRGDGAFPHGETFRTQNELSESEEDNQWF